jgi:biotin operon repressor
LSWTATAWAKERIKGLSAPYDKLMLMVLADYAHPESHEAWPTQATLAEVLGTSERQVRRSIRSLEREGLVKQIAKGNQYQKSLYRLEVILSGAQVQAPDNSAPDIMSPAHAPDRIDQVHRTKLTSAADSPAMSSLQEPPLEPPEEKSMLFDFDGHQEFHAIDGVAPLICDNRCQRLATWAKKNPKLASNLAEAAGAVADQVIHDPEGGKRSSPPAPWLYEGARGKVRYADIVRVVLKWARNRRNGTAPRARTSQLDNTVESMRRAREETLHGR